MHQLVLSKSIMIRLRNKIIQDELQQYIGNAISLLLLCSTIFFKVNDFNIMSHMIRIFTFQCMITCLIVNGTMHFA